MGGRGNLYEQNIPTSFAWAVFTLQILTTEAYNMFGIHWEQSTSRWSRSAPASTSSSELWMGGRMKKMDDMKKIDEICNSEQRNDFHDFPKQSFSIPFFVSTISIGQLSEKALGRDIFLLQTTQSCQICSSSWICPRLNLRVKIARRWLLPAEDIVDTGRLNSEL